MRAPGYLSVGKKIDFLILSDLAMPAPLRISVIIPVLNETANVNRLISHLRTLPPREEPEIIVVDGDSSGSTLGVIADTRVRTAVAPRGRAAQMNHGASLAAGDILLFLHADTLLPHNAFSLIRDALSDEAVAGGAFSLGIDSPRWYFRITERYVSLRTRFTRVPFGDQAIFLRRAYFEEIGGYKDLPIMEDVELMARIRKRGDAVAILPEPVTTSGRRWEREGIVHATLRNWLLQVLYCCGVPPRLLARFYQ